MKADEESAEGAYCVMPAAGASSRMGAWKLMLPFGRGTVVEAAIRAARSAGLRVVLVSGYRAEELERYAAGAFPDDPFVATIRNPGWESGMLGSLLCGFRYALGRGAGGEAPVFVAPADLPLIAAGTYGLLWAERRRRIREGSPDVPLAAAFDGQRGHPVLMRLSVALGAEALASSDGAMRGWLDASGLSLVETGDPGAVSDVDTREAYEDALRKYGGDATLRT